MREVYMTLRSPHARGCSLLVWSAAWLLVAALVIPLSACAGPKPQKDYTYETDPIRLGLKALEESRLVEAKAMFEQALYNNFEVYRAHYGLAEILRRQALYIEAEPLYRLALAEGEVERGASKFPEAHVGLGLVLLRLGRTAEAKREFETALKINKKLWLGQYGMARVSIEEGDYEKAKKFLEKGSGKKGLIEGEDVYLYGMALVLAAGGDLPEAEKMALQAFTMSPNDPEYGTLVAQIYARRGAPTLAIDAYERALTTPGSRPTAAVLCNLGLLYEQEKRYNEALGKYKEAVQADSTHAQAWKSMGALYVLAERYDDAAGAYLRYAQLEPRDPEGLLGLADACMKIRRFKQALEAAETAYDVDSTSVSIRLAYARALFQDGKKARSRALYATVTDTLAFEGDDYLRMGRLKLDEGNLAGAQQDLKTAVTEDSTSAEAYYYLGLVELKSNSDSLAVEHFDKAASLEPENATIRLNQGIAFLRLKRSVEAILALREAVRLAPTAAQAHTFLAQAFLLADSTSSAVEEYKKALEIEPENPGVLRGLGLCYLKRQADYREAVAVLEKATKLDPKNSDGWAWYGQALALQSRFQESITALEKALSINPGHGAAKKLLDVVRKGAESLGAKQ